MGRYLRRSSRLNASGEVTVVEVTQTQCPPLRTTRSRKLAVQRNNHQHQHQLASSAGKDSSDGSLSYLQLRNRRLEKAGHGSGSPRKCKGAGVPVQGRGASGDHCVEEDDHDGKGGENEGELLVRRMVAKAYAIMRWEPGDEEERHGEEHEHQRVDEEEEEEDSVQASCGDGSVQFQVVESRGERYSRETTPCSLIYIPDPSRTPPGSTTRRRPSHSRKLLGKDDEGSPGFVTTTSEMEEFFTDAEQHLQREFVHKYNFDVASECPLPGRYQWEKLQGGSSFW